MNTLTAPDLARDYLAWLKDRLLTVERGRTKVLSTPFLDPFHDGIEIYCDNSGQEIVLHDGGKTYENLMDLGIQIETSERRQAIIEHAIAGCGVQWANGRLQTVATPDSLPQRAHFLITAVSRLNDLWMTASPRSMSDFFAVVKEFFDAHDVHYIANVPIQGRTVAHPIDFAISLGKGRERLVKLMANPTLQAAKLASFAWIELREARPESQRVVLLNDTVLPDPLGEEGEQTSKDVSDKAEAVLQTYSHNVLRWSARNDPAFERSLVA